MWLKFVYCLLVGTVLATTNPAWKPNQEYVYFINGRTVGSLNDVGGKYVGILINAKISITPKSDNLICKIFNSQYAQINDQLSNGWNSNIPKPAYKILPLSKTPFKVVMKNGIVEDIKINKDLSNWEANVIRSIISQLQWDTKYQNLIPSHVNTLPQPESTSANYKTMEESITGRSETLYDIHPVPEYILQSKPWLSPRLYQNQNVLEIIKSKNYSNSIERPSYHYGLYKMSVLEPTSNQMAEFFIRDSISKAIVTGNINQYTIQNTYTVNKVIMSPTLIEKQKGSVVSMLNLTLSEIKPSTNVEYDDQNTISIGNLVYRFNKPFSTNNVREVYQNDISEETLVSSEEKNFSTEGRFRRSNQNIKMHRNGPSYPWQHDAIHNEKKSQKQDLPKVKDIPESPLLPYTMGFNGQSVKKHANFKVVKKAIELTRQIADDLEQTEKMADVDTLAKFKILATLTRIMDFDELEEVATELFTNKIGDKKYNSWSAFRDAVAECGTGPALLTIQKWIESKKVSPSEGETLISAMSLAVREPTFEYIHTFYSFLDKKEFIKNYELYAMTYLSLTDLIRKVYINKYYSHNIYPVHSFGTFRKEEGKIFVKNNLIPKLSNQLHESIIKGESKKIHLYITALGNLGHKQILPAFEPYLEGRKPASQFQRLLMIISLNKLSETNPIAARSVLYKVYQNIGDKEEIRAAAVFQLIRTQPGADMLQRMAEFTNEDSSKIVNAAVKSSIEAACVVENEEYQYLRSSAIAAKPLLTKETFETHFAHNYIRNYVLDELKFSLNKILQTIGDRHSILPKLMKVVFNTKIAGLSYEWINIENIVSSLDELTTYIKKKTLFSENKVQDDSNWSSHKIAEMLNMKSDEREKFEGLLNLKIGSLRKFWSFDNTTLKQLPEDIQNLEKYLKTEHFFHETKFTNSEEIAFAFPMEMGFPFLYTYDKPTLITYRGKLQASAKPDISSGKDLRAPEKISLKGETEVIFSSTIKGKLAFITPFDHQQYSTGYDKVYKIEVPLKGKMEIDLKGNQFKAEFEPVQNKNDVQLFHYSTWPYTAVTDILDITPISLKCDVINQKHKRTYDQTFGKESTGLAVRVNISHENDIGMNWINIIQRIFSGEFFSSMSIKKIQLSRLDVTFLQNQSTTDKLSIHLGGQNKYKSQNQEDKHDLSHLYDSPSESFARQQDFEKKVGAGMRNTEIRAYDASFEFEGHDKLKYTLTFATANSNIDPNSKLLVYYKKHSNKKSNNPYQIALSVKVHSPNINELDLAESLRREPLVFTQMYLAFGHEYESSSKIKAEIEQKRSKSSNKLLLENPLYKQCQLEIKQGNFQLPACASVNAELNKMDNINIKLRQKNIPESIEKIFKDLYHTFCLNFYPSIIVSKYEKSHDNEIDIKLSPSGRSFNVSMKLEDEYIEVADVPFRYESFMLPTEKNHFCLVDHSAVNTFNNRTFPISLDSWTVMLQYVPKQTREGPQKTIKDQLKEQLENYLVLVNGDKNNHKQVKLTLKTPETEGEMLDITMEPNKITVNDKKIEINNKTSHAIKDGFVEIYTLPKEEIKISVRNAFNIVYDGVRVKLAIENNKFRNALRGICGLFSDDQSEDLINPQNCIMKDTKEFINSYKITGKPQKNNTQQCIKKNHMYTNVISDKDAGREQKYSEGIAELCTIQQTRYIERKNQICFTRRSYPVCKCQQRGTLNKTVSVHCVHLSVVSAMWKNQIDRGLSPDFGYKKETNTVQLQLPQTCFA